MKELIKRIRDPEIPMKLRLYQLLSVIALAEFLIVTIYTVVIGGSAGHVAIMLAGTVVFTFTVSFTFRTNRLRLGSAISALLYFSLYPLTFFSSGGMYGGAPIVFAFALVYVYLATQKWERVLCIAVCVIAAAACYAVSYLHPETLKRATVMGEHVESMLSILLVTLLLSALFAFVTEVYRTENRIVQKQKREIEELNQAQKRFFSSMSHEIRTPVNAIIGLSEMTLREKNLPDEVRENSLNVEAAGRLLLHTVNEIMDMSKLETGGMEIVLSDYESTAMLSEIVGLIWLRAQEKGLDFIIRADPALPFALRGDEVRIKQILLNVLSNAVKYTKKGSVTLSVSGRTDEKGDFIAVYEVVDTGIGIREESIPHLFTAFSRFDEHDNHAIEGTGLGLSIVKQLLELMNGTVTVTSEYGKGSIFHIEIPQGVANAKPIGKVDLKRNGRRHEAETDGTEKRRPLIAPGVRVLAVDDTPMNLMVVRKLLRDTQVILDTAASGAEALQKTLEKRDDVI